MAVATTTAQNIIDRVQRDNAELFTFGGIPAGGSVSTPSLIIEYIDRAQQMILTHRRWNWMESTPKRFITERGQTDYWIGATGSAAAGQVDTTLNLTDVRWVKQGSALSRSGWHKLHPVEEGPLAWQNQDGSYQEGSPHSYRHDDALPNVISLYPAPDEGNQYELVPQAPHSTTAAGGALAARTYFIRTTFVDLAGNEGAPSTTARQFVEASKLVTVKAPQPTISVGSAGISYLRYNVYASTTEGDEELQASNIATSGDWTEPVGGLIAGVNPPSDSALEPLRGHVIEFRYYKKHTAIAAAATVLLIPDDYKDVVVACVNFLACRYLGKQDRADFWFQDYQAGLMRMVQDQNPFPGGARYVHPDAASYVSRDPAAGGGIQWSYNPDPT